MPATPVIAIDGPSASGKSTTAAAVARALGFLHLDSGALYRGLTAVALDLPPGDRGAGTIVRSAEARGLVLREAGGALVPFLDGRDAEPRIRSPEVTALVSDVSALAPVRAWVNARLARAAAHGGGRPLVIDGRDIGTAVFPDSAVKVFLTASPEVRAQRRLRQRTGRADPGDVAREAALLAERDLRDSTRAVAPLRRADDAVVFDTSALGFEAQVGGIVALVRGRLPHLAGPDKF
ncbi:MAG TPA: (d)CMP kinase [Gemmatimonadales bacterium]|jgi:cytidylate kinase|nr:(d)CMP kinase [Gemmatimonadales bacterium]